jgi:GNAT superfamily N-acetyltransferase
LQARIDRAAAHFRTDGVHWLLMVAADAVPEALRATLTGRCTDAGLEYVMPMFGMATDDLVDPVRPPPALDLQVVTTVVHRAAVGDLNAAGYGMPAELFGLVTGQAELWKDMIGLVGVLDGIPVATASVALIDHIAYVSLVATSPVHQRKGYAEAVMRRSLLEGRAAWGVQRTGAARDPGRSACVSPDGVRRHAAFRRVRRPVTADPSARRSSRQPTRTMATEF